MTGCSQWKVELQLYEEIIDMNYSTPMASRTSSPLLHDENESYNGPVVNSSESDVLSTSTEPVVFVTWPDPRYPCSLASSYQEPRLLNHLDGIYVHNLTTSFESSKLWTPTPVFSSDRPTFTMLSESSGSVTRLQHRRRLV